MLERKTESINAITDEDIQWMRHRANDLKNLYDMQHKWFGIHKHQANKLYDYIHSTCALKNSTPEKKFALSVDALYNNAQLEAQRLKCINDDGSGSINWKQVVEYLNQDKNKHKDSYLREILATLDHLNYAECYKTFIKQDLRDVLNENPIKLYGFTDAFLEKTYAFFKEQKTAAGFPPAIEKNKQIKDIIRSRSLAFSTHFKRKELQKTTQAAI